jgi:hypothetical protein
VQVPVVLHEQSACTIQALGKTRQLS